MMPGILPGDYYILILADANHFVHEFEESDNTAAVPVTIIGVSLCPTPVTYAGQTYNTVQIGTQCWFKENLNIGTRINGSGDQTNNGIIEKFCHGDLESNCDVFGGLYQWAEMMYYLTTAGVQGICPTGWHIPTDGEWCTLTQFLDPTVNCNTTGLNGTNAAGKMKSTGTLQAGTGLWYSPNVGATNESGFTAFKIYPNPTTGIFTIELNEKIPDENAQVDVYGIWGERVLTEMLNGERSHVFSLSSHPAGIYFIRVIAGTTVETIKVVRQ